MRKAFLLILLSFFITIDSVELKNEAGDWITVIRPDKRLDLASEEPAVRFFNNGRIPPGDYANVRVHFTAEEEPTRKMTLERKSDYSPPVSIGPGTFVGVSFAFDWKDGGRVSEQTLREVRLVTDNEERVDGSDRIKLWS